MDLPIIGSHCSLESCNDLDLLPIRCHCEGVFCRHHISPEAHACPAGTESRIIKQFDKKLERCAVKQCNQPSLGAFTGGGSDTQDICSQCRRSFCVEHRHPESHSCPISVDTPPTLKNEAAHAILTRNFPHSSANTLRCSMPQRKAVHTDPKKLLHFQKVELMKMHHRAIPANKDKPSSSTPIDQRLHVKVVTSLNGEVNEDERVFWLHKSTGTGRALDLLASHFGITSSSIQLVKLSIADAERLPLRNDQTLSSQIEDGCTLFIESFVH